jgi:hypothetical protein
MLLSQPELISLIHHQVGLEGHVEGDEHSEVRQQSNVAELEGADPFKHAGVLVDHLSLFEVEGAAGVLGGHGDKGLVGEGRMVDVFFKFEQPVERGSEEFRVSESVADVGVLLFRFYCNIVLVSFGVVVVVSDRTVEPLFFPFNDVFEGNGCVPGGVGDESVFVGEGPHLFSVYIAAGEAQVGQSLSCNSVGIEVGVDSGNTASVGTVEFGYGIPDFALNLEVVFEVVDDLVVLVDFGFVVVLVEFVVDVFGGERVLVG